MTDVKSHIHPIRLLVLTLLALAGFAASTVAQVVSILDPGLNGLQDPRSVFTG